MSELKSFVRGNNIFVHNFDAKNINYYNQRKTHWQKLGNALNRFSLSRN